MTRNDTGASAPAGEHRSIWLATTDGTDYEHLEDGLDVDVVVVGGGIVGITTALQLTEVGRSVALVERNRIVEGVTGNTTAKLTSLHGLVYDHLLGHFGRRQAHQYARANEAAIDHVEATVREYDVDCDFERTPAYTYTTDPDRRGDVRDEVTAASELGLPATFVKETALPYDVEAAVRFDEQAHFHPRKYLLTLAGEVADAGNYVFERTTATDVTEGDPCTVETDRGTITAEDVVLATHFPIVDPAFFFARMSPKRSYVLAVELAGDVPRGMYYDPDEPYFSVRPLPAGEGSTALIGGQNHRTGHGGSTEERYRALERQARSRFDVASVDYRWATQDYVSVDRVPFVGELSPGSEHVSVATGFGGWGMTNGVAAGRLLADLVLGRGSPWRDVFRPSRIELGASAGSFLEHNAHAMRHVVSDAVGKPPAADLRGIERGSGQVLTIDGDEVAVHRDEDGALHAVSARCTHMGCRVAWNDGESSWDCPCHGSRFSADGTVLDTPAVADLDPIDLGAIDVADGSTTAPPGTPAPHVEREELEEGESGQEEIER
jgi:glycine/D-amino acid oxidase-like deaminating enzyme/nitrite reductase/ring-hydroxylating ferredoxin subunit